MMPTIPLYKHTKPHTELARRYRLYASQQSFRTSVVLSVVLFIISMFINIFAINFATEHASNAVTDIVLSNIPVFDVSALFVYGTFWFAAITAVVVLAHPKRIPFSLHAITLFFITRSIFTSLTHTGPFVPHTMGFGDTIAKTFFGADLFFSGHTGLPFLGALIFWREPALRYFYLATSLFFAIIVLMGHIHYSIDVLSAFFITYGIYHIVIWLFPKEFAVFHEEDGAQTLPTK